MYAVIEVGSKQYHVKEKDIIEVERQLNHSAKDFNLGKVLLVKDEKSILIGQPYLKDYKVLAKLIRDFRGRKVISYKYIRREDSRWKKGHRQNLSLVQIVKISPEKVEKAEKKEEKKEEKNKLKK